MRIVVPDGVEQIVAGTSHIYVRLHDGMVQCAGANERGQLGVAGDPPRLTFASIAW